MDDFYMGRRRGFLEIIGAGNPEYAGNLCDLEVTSQGIGQAFEQPFDPSDISRTINVFLFFQSPVCVISMAAVHDGSR